LDSSLKLLESLLKEGHFLPAAHVSAAILTSSSVSQTDYTVIFYLLYIRLACLELTGNTILAAQEAKALEDLSSSFYYFDDGTEPMESTQETAKESTIARHIVPWHLRVLAVRLQSIGFGDARRGIAGLYELGLEARKHISRRDISNQERTMWKDRLSDLGIRVVNALVEMGDLDAARRSLASTETPAAHTKSWITRMVLLNLRVGDVEAARRALGSISDAEPDILTPLLSMAEGKYSDAAAEWSRVRENHSGSDDEAMIMQNLAVCLLYAGKLNEVFPATSYFLFLKLLKANSLCKAREILEALVEGENSFQALTFNLATIYELCSENANTLKLGLTERISAHPPSPFRNWERPSTDFKV
jgi:hypothetical protein